MSALRNYPVICCSRQIGLLQSISLDAARKRVHALVVSCGMRGKRVVLGQHVQAIADGFILAGQTEKYKRFYEKAGSPFVRDTTGMLAGCVTDYAVDEKTLDILAAEIMPGYWPRASRQRFWAFAYHSADDPDGDLIVPASLGSGLIVSREGI
ncbi:MAG: hypothetical protein ACI4MM_00560 [Candidatus Ventricola sp.]